ncbi:MAG: DEAD/DEAH box helicase [Myxococcota bacterium]
MNESGPDAEAGGTRPPPPSGAPLLRRLERLACAEPGAPFSIRAVHSEPARPARPGTLTLDPRARARLKPILERRGIETIWSHQAEALDAWSAGADVLLSTGTASGKSLVYSIATALSRLREPGARSLLLFPLKALERDQRAGLRADLESAGDDGGVEIYDGDTSPYRRRKIRDSPPAALLTTPDMLHAGILPRHESWRSLLSTLELIVLDEVHVYRGVLGTHMAQVLRRLLRLAHHHGAHPQVIACSATVGNPAAFIEELLGRPAHVVREDGAPRPLRHLAFADPGDSSPYTVASQLFRRCVHEGLRTLAFTPSRRSTELMHRWILERAPELAARVSSYRSGFLPEERRSIEQRLFSGDLLGVVSTSALELGIDVGGLDVCILTGYPGSVLATRQRAGRVGRGREGLVFLVPQRDALDHYFLAHPRALVERRCEDAILDAANPQIVAAHLSCAAAELPIRSHESWLEARGLRAALRECAREGRILESASGDEFFSPERHPARRISLREIGESYSIRSDGGNGKKGRVIGTIGAGRVFSECHPGAIYLHRARSFAVEALDLERREVRVRGPVRVDHYTRALGEKETEILETTRTRPLGNALLRLGRLRITSRITRYEKRRVFGQDLLGTHALDLPPRRFETEGMWLEMAREIEPAVRSRGGHFMGGIHGLEHTLLALFPLVALCDRFDAAGISIPRHPQVEGPAIFLYDAVPGGLGITRSLFGHMDELLEAARATIADCACREGCPSCVHSPRCGAGNRPLDKRASVWTADWILAREALPQVEVGPAPPPLEPPEDVEIETSPEDALYLDVETQRSAAEVGGWHNSHLMRVALAVVWQAGAARFETYLEDRSESLVEALLAAPLVIGFNVRRFDYQVLSAYSPRPLEEALTFDLLEDLHARLGFRISLQHLAECTLGRSKTADGLQSLEWFREGKLDLIETYCREDVAITRDLVEFARREGHIRYRHRSGEVVRLPVEWDLDSMRARAERARARPPAPRRRAPPRQARDPIS